MDFEPFLYMVTGGCIGGPLGYLLVRSKMQEALEERLEKLRKKTEERTRMRVEAEVREEMTVPIRRELVESFTDEARAEAQESVEREKREAEAEVGALIKEAKIKARTLLLEARDEAEEELKQRRLDLQKIEDRLSRREEGLDDRAVRLDEREAKTKDDQELLQKRETEMGALKAALLESKREVERALERVADMSADQARDELKERMIDQARMVANQTIKEIEEEAERQAEQRAQKIISIACQRYAGEFVTEKSVNVIALPSDELKGRIIGREGRNIRALETATGVDVIIDDTPEVVVVSSFDPVRREIARRALEKLIADGRIHPTRIEEVVEKSDQEVAQVIKDAGERAALELGIHGLHSELLNLVGQLKFRTSYGQNMWSHSIEVGFLCGLMASELGVNVAYARRAGLLHDIGKALTHERQESHALVGAELAQKYGENEIVRNAIAAHHNEEPQNSVIAHLVIAADALSGARPGARREILGTYVKRLEDLERISSSFEGVQKSYAIQAGREIRVMVEHSKIDDEGAFALSKEIARRIEDELTYPGQIKVTVIRETRATGYAR